MSGFVRKMRRRLDNQYPRDMFVERELSRIPAGSLLLDAGAGSQRYRAACAHLEYKAQDLGEYRQDQRHGITSRRTLVDYNYGPIDYRGNVWQVEEASEHFDAILCTEVLEHVPYPQRTIDELARLLKSGGTLILTAPATSLRHFDPFYYFSGFSDRWFETVLPEAGLEIEILEPVGDYYSWISVELARTAAHSRLLGRALITPALLYFMSRRRTPASINTLCMGYHIRAVKR